MARLATVNDIINRAAVEVGLLKSSDPVSDSDETFIQLVELLNSAGQELVELHPWGVLVDQYQLQTQDGDSGVYDLPDNYSYMIDQTGWERNNRTPMSGPLSAQDWAYLAGRDLVSQSIYASFRLAEFKFHIFPQPPPVGLDIHFEYISRNWILEANLSTPRDDIGSGSDLALLEPLLLIKFLKAKFLEAKGFDASSAKLEFENIFNSRTGKDEGAPILSASNAGVVFPYLDGLHNVSDSGYGIP